jgi:uncharacterized protein YcfL
MKSVLVATALVLLTLSFASCASREPYLSQDSTKYTLENTEKLVLLDEATRQSLGSTGLYERILPNGLLETAVILKNRSAKSMTVQVRCAFLDAEGADLRDEGPWRSLTLPGNSSDAVRFIATNPKARNYAIQVRLAH